MSSKSTPVQLRVTDNVLDLLDYMADLTGESRRAVVEAGVRAAAARLQVEAEDVEKWKLKRAKGRQLAEALGIHAVGPDAEERTRTGAEIADPADEGQAAA